MNDVVRRTALGMVLGGFAMASLAVSPSATAQTSCDPVYLSVCVPPVSEAGHLDCQYFYDQGIYGIQLADPTWDPHGLDGWNYVDDGIGCEGA